MDSDRISRIAAEVIGELRAMGLASPGAQNGAPSRSESRTAAAIRPYGQPAGESNRGPEPSMTAPSSGLGVIQAAPGSTLRPEDAGLAPDGRPTVTCNVSNRHIHLTKEHLEILYGAGAELNPRNKLMQPFQFAAKETVSLIAGRGRAIENIRILGPLRKYTQVEISRTDGFYLGIQPPVRGSGDIKGSASGTLVGPKGTLVLKEGIIIADRHIHTPPEAAQRFGLTDNQFIAVRISSPDKPTVLERVRIRISDEFLLEMHIDNDDANATGINSGDRVEMVI